MGGGLEEFAAKRSRRPGPPCRTCALPEDLLDEVMRARQKAKPISFRLIAEYLREQGCDVTHNSLRDHFLSGH